MANSFKNQLYINGKWVDPVDGGTFDTINPANGCVITKVANATKIDVDQAIQAAKTCLNGPTWGYSSTGQQRAVVLRRLGVLVTARKDELARLDSLDQGKPLRESEADLNDTITACEHFAMLAETHDIHVETIDNGTGGDFTTTVVHEPIGVVAGNNTFPLLQIYCLQSSSILLIINHPLPLPDNPHVSICYRRNHSLELPVVDGSMESVTRVGSGLHGCSQTF